MCLIFFNKFYFLSNNSHSKTMEDGFYFILKALFALEIFNFLYFHPSSPLFLPINHCFRAWSKINLEFRDVINCLNENLIIHFAWYLEKEKHDIETLSIDRVLNKEQFYGKIMQENVQQKLVPDCLFIFVNNPMQPLHSRNSLKNKIFWERIIENP